MGTFFLPPNQQAVQGFPVNRYYTKSESDARYQPIGSGGTWGSITGTLSNQTDLQSALNAKQATLVSGTNIRTLNGTTLLGSGDISIPVVLFGNQYEIPFVNGTNDNFEYLSQFSFNSTEKRFALAEGIVSTTATTTYGMVLGQALGTDSYFEVGRSASAHGYISAASDNAYIKASGDGSTAMGQIDGADSFIEATNYGTLAFGRAINGGQIIAQGEASFAGGSVEVGFIKTEAAGAMAFGRVSSSDSSMVASADGSFAFGYSENGHIYASNTGAFAIGRMSGGELRASGEGCLAFTSTDCDGASYVETSGEASSAFIKLDGTGAVAESTANGTYIAGSVDSATMRASANAAIATGSAISGGLIEATGGAAKVGGYADGADSILRASGTASFVQGSAQNGQSIIASGQAAFAGGDDSLGNILASGARSFLWGSNLTDYDGATAHTAIMFGDGMVADAEGFYVGFGQTDFKVVVGGVYVNSLDTDNAAPAQSGTIKMVTTDEDGLLSFDDIPSGGASRVLETHTSGATITVDNDTTVLHVDPASTLAALTITLAATPAVETLKIIFGGDITSGTVVTTLSIVANTGHAIIENVTPTTAEAGDSYTVEFISPNWHRI